MRDYTDGYSEKGVTKNDPGYPLGKAENATTKDAFDGFPIRAEFINDILGFFQALIKHAQKKDEERITKRSDEDEYKGYVYELENSGPHTFNRSVARKNDPRNKRDGKWGDYGAETANDSMLFDAIGELIDSRRGKEIPIGQFIAFPESIHSNVYVDKKKHFARLLNRGHLMFFLSRPHSLYGGVWEKFGDTSFSPSGGTSGRVTVAGFRHMAIEHPALKNMPERLAKERSLSYKFVSDSFRFAFWKKVAH